MNLKVYVKDNQIGIKKRIKRDMRFSNAKTAGLCCIRNFKYPFCITSLAKEGVSSGLSATRRFPRSSKQYNCTKKVKKKVMGFKYKTVARCFRWSCITHCQIRKNNPTPENKHMPPQKKYGIFLLRDL